MIDILPHRSAVIDIGSNSVRLVVYEGLRRAPAVIFNEKVPAGLGRRLAIDGRIADEDAARGLVAPRRDAWTSGVVGNSVSVRVDLGGPRTNTNQTPTTTLGSSVNVTTKK